MPTLYYATGACSLAPHIVLEWIGALYQAVRVNHGSAALREVNSAGAVPTFREDDGWLLTQAGAILHYLSRKHPKAKLDGGTGAKNEAEEYKWSSFLTSDVHASFWPIFKPSRFTSDKSKEAQQAVVPAVLKVAEARLATLDAHLADRNFILGDRRSVIDAYAFPMLRWTLSVFPDGLGRLPHLEPLHNRLQADAAVAKVLEREASKHG